MVTAEAVFRAQDHLLEALDRRRRDLERYAKTIEALHSTNVASDETYQRIFNVLYGVRRNQPWRSAFYDIFESSKRDVKITFRSVLLGIFEATGRVEASFASKLVATIDPSKPIYDSVVRKNLGIQHRTGGVSTGRIEALESDYNEIHCALSQQIRSPIFRDIRTRFDSKFPCFGHFTDMKVFDLLVWQIR